ncbi:MAG: HD domain-containing protein [Sphingobacteriales bacterium]|nr:MAG: HD domain-containing protein [Sphingobacteriales bacterium]
MKWIKDKNWDALLRQYSWVADMEDVPQSPIHHAEGDVATHTRMVLDAMEQLSEYKALPEEDRELLWMAALMHDIEKRSTTFTDEHGDIVSPGHAKKGALTARQLLFTGFNLPFETREQIVNLVRYHGLPIWLMHKPDPQKALLEASLVVNTQWLYILAKADMLGRICGDLDDMLERIAFFEAYCSEQGCWGTPYPFANRLARFHYFQTDGNAPAYVPFDDTSCEVVVMSGLPGMGKDHYLATHAKGLPVISLDEIRRKHKLKPTDKSASGWVAQQAKEEARVFLRAGQSFAWNATNITRNMRSQLIALFAGYRARVRLVYVEQPYNTWLSQNAQREDAVPAPVLTRMLHKLEIPTPAEAHEVLYCTGK